MNSPQRSLFVAALVLAVSLTSMVSTARAQTALDRLHIFFTGLKTLKADFKQTVQGARFTTEESSQGSFVIARPGKFRWHYQIPYEQLIVSDGKKVWIYDVDLEQVTVKPLGATLGNTPALLLSGEQPLEQNFVIKDEGERDGLAWVSLQPKQTDVSFTKLRLGFGPETLRVMVLEDNLGQTTWLEFNSMQRNTRVDPALFHFEPPAGVDVFDAVE